MNREIQDIKAIGTGHESVEPVNAASANWMIRDPKGEYREKIRAARIKYSDRFHKGEIRNTTDFVKWLLNNVDAFIEFTRPEPVS